MLAQNFKTATDLRITDQQLSALVKTLALMDSGKLEHRPKPSIEERRGRESEFSGEFNMAVWDGRHTCGTVCCIGGTAELVGGLERFSMDPSRVTHPELHELFYPTNYPQSTLYSEITVEQAATALRSYLTTGDARWDLALTT